MNQTLESIKKQNKRSRKITLISKLFFAVILTFSVYKVYLIKSTKKIEITYIYASSDPVQIEVLENSKIRNVLKDNDVELDKYDYIELNYEMIELNTNARISQGDTIQIYDVEKTKETIEEDIPFEVKRKEDSLTNAGIEKVETPGENGKKEITFELTFINGGLRTRKEKSTKVVKEKVDEVILIGTKTINNSSTSSLPNNNYSGTTSNVAGNNGTTSSENSGNTTVTPTAPPEYCGVLYVNGVPTPVKCKD